MAYLRAFNYSVGVPVVGVPFTCHTLAFQDSLWAYTMFQL